MNELSKGTKIILAVLGLSMPLLVAATTYVNSNVMELRSKLQTQAVKTAIIETQQKNVAENIQDIKSDVRDLRELFLGPKSKTE